MECFSAPECLLCARRCITQTDVQSHATHQLCDLRHVTASESQLPLCK